MKLYTDRYVKKLKASHRKVMLKFTAGTNYALRAQKKQIMARASRLVIDSHKRIIETFQNESMCLLDQVDSMKLNLYEAELKVERLLKLNYSQEVDLAIVLK